MSGACFTRVLSFNPLNSSSVRWALLAWVYRRERGWQFGGGSEGTHLPKANRARRGDAAWKGGGELASIPGRHPRDAMEQVLEHRPMMPDVFLAGEPASSVWGSPVHYIGLEA